MNIKYFECDCHSYDHTLRFCWFPDEDDIELYVETRLNRKLNFFKRCWVALKYIFKKDGLWEHNEETILNEDNIKELHKFTEELLVDTNYIPISEIFNSWEHEGDKIIGYMNGHSKNALIIIKSKEKKILSAIENRMYHRCIESFIFTNDLEKEIEYKNIYKNKVEFILGYEDEQIKINKNSFSKDINNFVRMLRKECYIC